MAAGLYDGRKGFGAVDFIASLKIEIEALESSLRARPDPRVIKLQELRRVMALYTDPMSPVNYANGTERKPAGRKISPERLDAIEATKKVLREVEGPIKTSELFDRISKMGIKLGGKDPKNNYSALLYGRDDFKSHGREGWTLKTNKGSPAEASEPS